MSTYERFATRLTNKSVVGLILPKDMNEKDYDLLVEWVRLLEEAAMYEKVDQPQAERQQASEEDVS